MRLLNVLLNVQIETFYICYVALPWTLKKLSTSVDICACLKQEIFLGDNLAMISLS